MVRQSTYFFPDNHHQVQLADICGTALQPTSANVSFPLVLPRLQVSSPHEDNAERKSRREHAVRLEEQQKEQGRTSGSEWVDVDEDRPKRRRKTKRTTSTVESSKKQTPKARRVESSDFGRFFPKLSQILESTESKPQPRSRQHDLRSHVKEDDSPTHRRLRTRSDNLQRQHDSLLQFNASLLSVISGLTTSTDRSSGSNSTITQKSYSRRGDSVVGRPHKTYRRTMSGGRSPPPRANALVEDYDDHDERSVVSVSSSLHQSESGSSIDTPSSRSTYPSPTFSRNSNADGKDPVRDLVTSQIEVVSTDASELSIQSQGTYDGSSIHGEGGYYFREPDTNTAQEIHETQQPLLAPLPAHPSAFSSQHFQSMQRSHSHSSAGSSQAQHQALQRYQHQPLVPESGEPLKLLRTDETVAENAPPAAPDAPPSDHQTVAGYEMLAMELSSPSSSVRPIYRKFEFLNHRLLLHLQDELAELEEQLRRADEIIAQMHFGRDGQRSPASRRSDAYYGCDIHHHRTALLGRIFVKTDQYNKAMSSYSTMVRDCAPAKAADVSSYQAWMMKEQPVHELEARFLTQKDDLVMPGTESRSTTTYLPVALALLTCSTILILPPALFAVIPSITGRLAVVLCFAVTAILLRLVTSLRGLLSLQDTSACAAAFVLLMSTVAFCVPQHATEV